MKPTNGIIASRAIVTTTLSFDPPEELEQPFAAAYKGERHRLLLDYIVALTDHEVVHQFTEE
ncbi:hypothetical protein K8R78_02810 [bacterium]|nr:hypothetical protein [bacterium]